MQNTDGWPILTVEVSKNKIAKTSKIYLNKFARYFGLQQKPSLGAERKKEREPWQRGCTVYTRPQGHLCFQDGGRCVAKVGREIFVDVGEMFDVLPDQSKKK